MLFLMLYGGAAATSLILCFYLLLSKVNVIAPGNMPPARLRRWAASFFGVSFAGHCLWFLAYASGFGQQSWPYVLVAMLDFVTVTVTVFGTLLSTLQDRRRPVWPFAVATLPLVVLGGLQIAVPAVNFLTPMFFYSISVYALFTFYMVIAVRQYSSWLSEYYVDLEHKEERLSHTLTIFFLLLLINYGFADDSPAIFLLRLTDFVL